jgi:hypothetical protein
MPQENFDTERLRKLVEGLSLILKLMQEGGHTTEPLSSACAFDFKADEMLVGQPSLFDAETLARLKELGFHVNDTEDHFYIFS